MNLIDFFIDPVLRAPTIASMLMCFATALIGVLVFVRKRSLLGEALSHATYPGVTFAIVIAGMFSLDKNLPLFVLLGAFISSLLGFYAVDFLEKKLRVSSDAALSAILALFFGVGVTVASYAQFAHTHYYRQMQTYLYGQAATMTDIHIVVYGVFALLTLAFIVIFFKGILTLCFDRNFAETCGIGGWSLELLMTLMIVISLVMGVRCVGVILMSAMLIAPATAARQFTNRLSYMFLLSGFFGAVSAFLGVYLSVSLSQYFTHHYTLPTGPMTVLMAGIIALGSLLFAPQRGLLIRYLRIVGFRHGCIQENLLKTLWRLKDHESEGLFLTQVAEYHSFSTFYLGWQLFLLRRKGFIQQIDGKYLLTQTGKKRGAHIVRLHRLWEAYLVYSLGLKVERVHKSAEEMEHILTPELEKKLAKLLDNPKRDPHQQPIPSEEEVLSHG